MVTLCNRINFECESSPDTLRTIFNELNKLRQTETLCDVKIDIGDRVFPCHRNILSSSCEYFRAMFGNTSFMESRNESVELQGIDPDIFEEILNFIYTGKVHITEENLSSLLVSGEYLGLHYLEDLCLDCVKEHIPISNVGSLFRYALERKKNVLVDTLCAYIAVNFINLSKSNELIDLSSDALTRVLTCPELQSSSSATTSFLLKWMNVLKEQECTSNTSTKDTSDVEYLLKMITSNGEAQKFIPEPRKNFIANAQSNKPMLRFFTAEYKQKSSFKFPFRRRVSQDYYYRGGMYEIKPFIKMMGSFKRTWGVNKTPTTYLKSVVFDEEIMYVFNNDEEGNFVPSIWTKRPRMSGEKLEELPFKLSNTSPVLVGGRIYFHLPEGFIGYECERNSWFTKKNENTHFVPVVRPCLVSMNNNMYIVGRERPSGSSTAVDDSGCLLQHFDPRTGQFNRLPNSLFEHIDGAACAYDDKIYVSGGTNISYYNKVVEVFEPVANKWRALARTPIGRMGHILIPYKKHLYAIGGLSKKGKMTYNSLCTCVYDVEGDKWLESIYMPKTLTDSYNLSRILDAIVF